MITIRKAALKDYASLLELRVDEEQKTFVSDFADLYPKRTPKMQFYVICKQKELLGFFVVDTAYASKYTFAKKNELGLRNLFINNKYQGKGFGQEALKQFFTYSFYTYADYSSICLTVNKLNLTAYRCYEKAGFVDSGDLYFGGNSGPQHIMRKKIG